MSIILVLIQDSGISLHHDKGSRIISMLNFTEIYCELSLKTITPNSVYLSIYSFKIAIILNQNEYFLSVLWNEKNW